MNIDDFKYVSTLAELGSFRSAANALYIAQPSLSQRIKYIEKEYGILIFHREPRGVTLTEEGRIFVAYARKILNCESDLRTEIQNLYNPKNAPLLIGIPQVLNSPYFSTLFQVLYERNKDINFHLLEETSHRLQQMLLNNEVHIAFTYLPVESKELSYEMIYSDRYVLVPAKNGKLEQRLLEEG